MDLNDLMQFDHVIRVNSDGTVEDDIPDVWAPESAVGTDGDGSILAEHEQAWVESIQRQGWELMCGWSGAYLAGNTAIMHPSEFIGGGIAEHILENPGLYCAITVETVDDDEEAAGWAVCYRSED